MIIIIICRPGRNKMKIKEKETRSKYQDLARELKKLWNMRVTVLLNVICAFETVPKVLVRGLEELSI